MANKIKIFLLYNEYCREIKDVLRQNDYSVRIITFMKILRQDTSLSKKILAVTLVLCSAGCIGALAISFWLYYSYQHVFLPGTKVSATDITGLTKEQALLKLEQLPPPEFFTVNLFTDSTRLASSSADLGAHYAFDQSIETAFNLGRASTPFTALFKYLTFAFSPQYQIGVSTPVELDEEKTVGFVKVFALQADQPNSFPSAEKQTNGQIVIFTGKVGLVVDQDETVQTILTQANPNDTEIEAVIIPTGAELTEQETAEAQERASKLLNKSLPFVIDKQRFTLNDAELIKLLGFPLGFHEEHVRAQLLTWESQVKRPGQNAVFVYDPDTLNVETFVPHRDGWTLDILATQHLLLTSVTQLEQGQEVSEVALPLVTSPPDITLAKSNTLGIQERIGFGESYYDHSIPSRIHNVSNAVNIINNTIVAPGEEFSFNKALGDVSAKTGFKPAYIIQQGRTVLGDGGGVCQVSTTLFRALLDSGLDITKRKQHSYRVSYYELDRQPGFDAAVFSGETDLRFVNDSPSHVLLHFFADPAQKYMYVEIYGTSDGRTTEITGYEKWGARSAPPPVYTDDPSLPAGKIVQVDWAVGGIRAKFTHITRDKNGNIIREKEYASNYIPWSAKYLRGTGI